MNHNLNKIDQSMNSSCQMYSYQLGHSSLLVIVRTPTEEYVITFVDVGYIEGPTSWIGSEFTQKNSDDSFRFAQSIGWTNIEKGDFTLFEAKANRRWLVNGNWFQSWLFELYLTVLSLLPFSNYKKRSIRILARYNTVSPNNETL